MSTDTHADITVYLLRHGQTELNAAGRIRGRIDVALDATGLAQAEALGRLFEGVPLQRVIASPLQRAQRTAAPVAHAAGLTVAANDAFNDRDYGQWAGERRSAIEDRFGSLEKAPGVESRRALSERIEQAFHQAVSDPDVTRIAIVGHDATNRVLLAALIPDLADDPESIAQDTGCWNKLVYRDGTWQAVIVNARPGDGHTP